MIWIHRALPSVLLTIVILAAPGCGKGCDRTPSPETRAPAATESAPQVDASGVPSATPATRRPASSTSVGEAPPCKHVDDDCGGIEAIVASVDGRFESLKCQKRDGQSFVRVTLPSMGDCSLATGKAELRLTCTKAGKLPAPDAVEKLRDLYDKCFKAAGWSEWTNKEKTTVCSFETEDYPTDERLEKHLVLQCVQTLGAKTDAGTAADAGAGDGASSADALGAAPEPARPGPGEDAS